MKIVLVVLVVLVGLWLLRGAGRRRDSAPDKPAPPPPGKALDAMVACAHCGVHLPRTEALAGPGGAVFCGEAHRAAAEQGGTR